MCVCVCVCVCACVCVRAMMMIGIYGHFCAHGRLNGSGDLQR